MNQGFLLLADPRKNEKTNGHLNEKDIQGGISLGKVKFRRTRVFMEF